MNPQSNKILPFDGRDMTSISRQSQPSAAHGAWSVDLKTDEVCWTEEIHDFHRLAVSPTTEANDNRTTLASWAQSVAQMSVTATGTERYELDITINADGGAPRTMRFVCFINLQSQPLARLIGTAFEMYSDTRSTGMLSIASTRRKEEISDFREFAIEAAEIGIWEWNAAEEEATYIENCLELLGVGSDGLRTQYKGLPSKDWENLIHSDDRSAYKTLFDKHLQGQSGLLDLDHRMMHADGSYRWFNTHGKVVEWDEEGRPLRMAGIFRDIHDRKTIELRSQENEARFRGVFDNTRRLATLLTPEGKTIITNPVGNSLTGLTLEEASGLHFWEGHWWLNDDDRQKIKQAVCQARHGKAVQFEIAQRAADGFIYTSDFSIAPILDDKGNIAFLLAEANDITDLKLLQKELRQSEKLFREAFEFGPVGATILNSEARYLEVNEAFARMLGYQPHELVGLSNREITVAGDLSADLPTMFELLDEGDGRITRIKQYVHRNGGTIDVRLEIATISGDIRQPDDNLRFLCFAQDLTELRTAQQALHTSELRSDLAIFSAGIGVWEWNARNGLDFYSQRAREILDIGPAEMSVEDGWIALIHPADLPGYLISRNAHLEGQAPVHKCELRILQKNGTYKWVDDFGQVVERDEAGRPIRMVGTLRDITETVEQHNRIERLAFSDPLTKLPNRTLFVSRCESALSSAREDQKIFALMIIDLDNFKDVNDTLGHAAGDQLLCDAAARLSGCLNDADTLARLGGDEFAVILESVPNRQDIVEVAARLLAVLSPPFQIMGQDLFVSASLGIAVYPEQGTMANELFARADAALYEAKSRGRNNFQFYDFAFTLKAELKLKLGNSLRTACANNTLELAYQPKVELKTGRIIGAEALLRWRHPELGLLMPNAFIALAEENGTIVEIGHWVIREAAKAAASWNRNRKDPLKIAVNLSARQFVQNDLVAQVRQALEETGCSAAWFECEITESLLLKDETCVQKTLEQLHRLGVSIAIDDFGTGQSALSYLNRFPIDVLKIDRSFITEMNNNVRGKELVKAFILIADALGMETVAEGVETPEQAEVLRALGCATGQGYLYGRPVTLERFQQTIATFPILEGIAR